MKLGEVLIQKGIITRRQLEETLRAQIIYGGHLGTCLIEKGFIDEPRLGQILAETSGMKYASKDVFHEIPRYVINALPPKLATKHAVVPFRLTDKVLHVAMIDPRNLLALDELSFAAGYKIEPWISPEVRIYQAMERYYEIPRRQRYVALCRRLDEAAGEPELIVRMEREDLPRARDGAESPVSYADTESSRTAGRDALALEAISDVLCSSENRDAMADAVLGQAARGLARIVLFQVQGGTAFPWRAHGLDLRGDPALARFSVVGEPVFGLVQGETHFRGSLPGDAIYLDFYATLGVDPPSELILLPLYLDDRLIALFYGDGGPTGCIRGETEEYRRLVQKLALALHLVVLKRQIRAA
jgi:hypothetical protein